MLIERRLLALTCAEQTHLDRKTLEIGQLPRVAENSAIVVINVEILDDVLVSRSVIKGVL